MTPDHQRAIHLECGHEANAVAHCSQCGERLTRRNVSIEPAVDVMSALSRQHRVLIHRQGSIRAEVWVAVGGHATRPVSGR